MTSESSIPTIQKVGNFFTPNYFHSSLCFTYGYLRLTPSVLEILKDVPTPKGLNVNSHR